jgi:carboxylesterase type B
MDAEAVLRLYPAHAFPTPKDALARLTGDIEFVCETRRVARTLHHEGASVYFYSFEHTVDVLQAGRAAHSLDLNFLFGNNFVAPVPYVLTASDLSLFRSMSTYWRQFVETGNPNHPDNPIQWPAFRPQPSYGSAPVDPDRSDRYLVIDQRRIGEASYLRDEQCNFWESFYFRSVLGTVPASAR